MSIKELVLGLLFTVLYSSGAVAMKFGLLGAPPLTLVLLRFLLAGALLLLYVYVVKKGTYRWPGWRELFVLAVLGLLNTSLFLGLGVIAMQTVDSGIYNLMIPFNALLFAIFASLFLQQNITAKEWLGISVAIIGLVVASIPAVRESNAAIEGILLLAIAVLSLALGSVIYKKSKLDLPPIVINTWQVVFGGLLLIVPVLVLEAGEPITVNRYFVGYLLWSVFGLSIFTLSLWFYLLEKDALAANNWMLLNPVSGYLLGAVLLGEALTAFSVIGTLFVLFGLYLSGNFNIKRRPS